jgi:PAS domain S-box-containing protein
MLATNDPEYIVQSAVSAIESTSGWRAVLDDIPLPVYTTDEAGTVTYWNRAAADFAGREPKVGEDQWCVTWQLYTTAGQPLPHEQCPMAEAIRQKRIMRNAVAIAKRPDGSRAAFRPYPTPFFNADGSLRGAINLLLDVSAEQRESLQREADRCHRLAEGTYDRATSQVLRDMASGFERTAAELS